MTMLHRAVRFQHRVATGHSGTRLAESGRREHTPTPTELREDDALVLSEVQVAGEEFPRMFLLYCKEDGALIGSDWQSGMNVAFDVPHKSHEDSQNEIFWWDPMAETTEGRDAALQAIADEGAVKQPSAEDLDAVAEEEQVKEATAPKNNVRTIRGSKVAK